MIDFNQWRCRNCKHFHTIYTEKDRPENACSNPHVDSNYVSFGCMCMKWESNDNLFYLEEKLKVYEKRSAATKKRIQRVKGSNQTISAHYEAT